MSAARSRVDLDQVAATCFSAVFSDVCDALGLRLQTAGPTIRALTAGDRVLVGWARTAHSRGVTAAPARAYGAEIDFIDSLAPGDVVVAAVDEPVAFWGELFSAAAMGRGARGAVIDGLIRDTTRVDELGFPVFATGTRPTDSLGRISIDAVDEPVSCGGVVVNSGDLVVADRDGITFIPAAVVEDAVSRATAKALTESKAKQMLLGGATLASAWERFRVL